MSTIRTQNTSVTFHRPFHLPGLDETQPPGTYAVEYDEELIQEVSFPAYRRTSAWITLVDKTAPLGSSGRMRLDPQVLDAALKRDAAVAG